MSEPATNDNQAPVLDWSDDTPIPLSEYATKIGKDYKTVMRDASTGRLVSWKDEFLKVKVTSLAAVKRMRDAAQAKAEAEFLQKQALEKGSPAERSTKRAAKGR